MEKKVVILIIGLSLAMFVAGRGFAAEKWALGCSGAGSGPYVWGSTIARVINTNQDVIRISPQATAGYNENVILVANGKIPVAQQTGSGFVKAYTGKKPFKKPYKRLRLLFTFNVVPFHVVTREAAKIKTVADLKGKKMNISLPAQITRSYDEAFLKAAGLKKSDIKVFEMATGQTFRALQNKVIDATGNLYSLRHGRLLELMTNTKIKLLDLPGGVVKKMLQLLPGTIPFTIPANTYKGTDYPVHTVAAIVVLFCRNDLSEDLVYTFTKAFWDNLAEVQKDPAFTSLKREMGYSSGIGCPYHPGALKYFKESGMVK